ncbi:MAG: hypothetical protein K1X31_04025 [Gemmatimonadaceae bacterium]|nr:hypothetical protein [Gemmatimonadaceae bacterium]
MALALALAIACGGDPAGAALPPAGGGPPLDPSPWVAATDGTIPLVIVVSHGGSVAPAWLPDRDCVACVTATDLKTHELAIAIADGFDRRVGARPFVVANLLHRRKFDANRAVAEATGGHVPLEAMWTLFHARIDSAKARALRQHPRALLIDLHGHGHPIARLEIGYLLTSGDLRAPDAVLAPRFSAAGVAAVPSAALPAPAAADAYFSGGYNTWRHDSLGGGAVDAIQVESHYLGVRDTPAARTAFAETFVTVLLQYLADHYDWRPA